MTKQQAAKHAETQCRERIGPERFDELADLVASLPKSIDRASIYNVIMDARSAKYELELFDPAWCRKRDAALKAVGRSIENLKIVLGRSLWVRFDTYADDLENEYRKLITPHFPGHVPLLRLSRYHKGNLSRSQGGRPRETWRGEAIKKLVALGIPRDAGRRITALDLLKAAGLA
jgi:hypothetical protein